MSSNGSGLAAAYTLHMATIQFRETLRNAAI
jgi:hypothetical protein